MPWMGVGEHRRISQVGERSLSVRPPIMPKTDVIAGILPPPLTKQPAGLPRDELYELHVTRLTRLSLHRNVFLKVLPPVVESKVDSWYDNKKELDTVIKMYRKLL